MGFKTIQYYNGYEKAIQLALKPNLAEGKSVTLLTQPKK
jgi:hypothetical protein